MYILGQLLKEFVCNLRVFFELFYYYLHYFVTFLSVSVGSLPLNHPSSFTWGGVRDLTEVFLGSKIQRLQLKKSADRLTICGARCLL